MASKKIIQQKKFPRQMSAIVATHETDFSTRTESPVHLNFSGSYLLSVAPVRLSMFCNVDCFAIRLARFLMDIVTMNLFPLTKDGHFHESFYQHCMKAVENTPLSDEINDGELLIIYVKQTIILLKSSGFVYEEGGIARVTDSLPPEATLYARLFNVFWNDIEWDEIFTSDLELARELKKNRYILMDLTLKHGGTVRIEELANDFFELTGFSRPGDLFSISFIDFYFYTWLKHFGIITYSSSGDFSPVSIEVTEKGRNLMKAAI